MRTLPYTILFIVLMCAGAGAGVPAQCLPPPASLTAAQCLSPPASLTAAKIAIVPGGDPRPDALLALSEAKLFEHDDIILLDRMEINRVLVEQRLSGMFSVENAIELGRILRADIFAVLEPTSIVIFDAHTGLRFVDETLPEQIEEAAQAVAGAVKIAAEKRKQLDQGELVTFGILSVRNVDFPVARDAWCRAVAGMLERVLLQRGGAVLERSRLQHVTRERQLTGNDANDLLASMKLIDLAFTRGDELDSFKLTAYIGNDTFYAEGTFDNPLDVIQNLAGQLLEREIEVRLLDKAARFATEALFFNRLGKLEEAIEKMEVAVALQPENSDYQRHHRAFLERLYSDLEWDIGGRINNVRNGSVCRLGSEIKWHGVAKTCPEGTRCL